ncbi:MAG: hypothetical protein OHK0036_05550 [Bacteroidia bacterium]
MKKLSTIFLLILIAFFFGFSAFVKLEPLEPFKFILSEQLHIKSWWLVEILSRLIISIELFIALGLLTFIHTKKIIQFSILFLIVLSLHLLYVWIFFGASEDCGCFGDYLHLSVKESLLKNIILIILLIITYKWLPFELSFKYKNIVLFSSLLISLALPWIFNSPDKFYENPYTDQTGKYLNVEILGKFNNGHPADSLKSGKKILCFFSTTCKFCAFTAKKITLFQKNYNIQLPVYYVFWGDEKTLKIFWEKSESFQFPYQIVYPDVFFTLSGNQLPAVYFLENGIIKAKHGYRTMDDKDILQFIQSK